MASLLEQLRGMTTVVSDTGDINAIEQYKPQDSTTNPSLIAAAAENARVPVRSSTTSSSRPAKTAGPNASDKDVAAPRLQAPRRRLRHARSSRSSPAASPPKSTPASPTTPTSPSPQARDIIAQYDKAGISRDRVLIKLASTWEGIQAAEILEKEGIHCNMTLLFGLHQAIACRRSQGHPHLALRRPHSRLVQEGHRQGLQRRRRSRRPVRHHHLQLLQEIRLQDRRHGRQLPQHRRDQRTRRLRPAHHRAQAARRARSHRRHPAAQARSRQGART